MTSPGQLVNPSGSLAGSSFAIAATPAMEGDTLRHSAVCSLRSPAGSSPVSIRKWTPPAKSPTKTAFRLGAR